MQERRIVIDDQDCELVATDEITRGIGVLPCGRLVVGVHHSFDKRFRGLCHAPRKVAYRVPKSKITCGMEVSALKGVRKSIGSDCCRPKDPSSHTCREVCKYQSHVLDPGRWFAGCGR